MSLDPDYIKRRIAYIDTVRAIHPNKRMAGFWGCLIGVVLLAFAKFRDGSPQWMLYAGLAVIGASWLLFVYVVVARTRYTRAHPFDGEPS